MAGTELIGLQNPLHVLMRQRRLYLGAAMAVDHIDVFRLEGARGADHVLQNRYARQGLHAFREIALHSLTLTRS